MKKPASKLIEGERFMRDGKEFRIITIDSLPAKNSKMEIFQILAACGKEPLRFNLFDYEVLNVFYNPELYEADLDFHWSN